MDVVIPRRNNGQPSFRHTYDEEGIIRNVEPLERIQEDSEYSSSRAPPSRGTKGTRGTRPSVAWPFHHRNASEAPSTSKSSIFSGILRPANWQSRTFFRHQDDSMSLDRSIVPDYIVNYLKGETPETLARKKEERLWGKRDVGITNHRDTFTSHAIEFDNFVDSRTDLTRGMNGYSSDSRRSGLRRHATGWRGGVVFTSLMAFVILVVAIISLILVLTKTKILSGATVIYSGECSKADSIDKGIQAVINLLTVALLAGANYVFQVLSSPTLREVTNAHAKRRWLDIGIPSIRNLTHISGFRTAVAIIILLTAVTCQVIYNAIIFTTRTPLDQQDPAEVQCSVNLSGSMLGVAALLNLATVIGMAVVLVKSTFRPIATIGDAVRCFLQNPDPTTAGSCLLTKTDVRKGGWGFMEAKAFEPRDHLWIQTPSMLRWVLTLFTWIVAALPPAVALALLIQRMEGAGTSNVFTPFGIPTPDTTFAFPTASINTAQISVVATLPHLLLAILYLTTNSLLTAYFLSHEFSLFATAARNLRVSSNPSGRQSTSLYLTLPRPVSWLLILIFSALGFVLSQAVFPVAFSTFPNPANPPPQQTPPPPDPNMTVSIAFSTQALVAILALLAFLLLLVLGLGLSRTPAAPLADGQAKGNPLALKGGSCSAVITAKCHVVNAAAEGELWLGSVAWGVVDEATGMRVGRCAFTGNGRGCVDVGRLYS